MCSYPPFDGDSDKDFLRSVSRVKYSFPSPQWDNVSPDAKNLIRKLLSKNPKRRPTASEALADDWLHKVGECCKGLELNRPFVQPCVPCEQTPPPYTTPCNFHLRLCN